MSAEYAPVRVVFRGWRERKGTKTIKLAEHPGDFPSINDIGASGRFAGKPNFKYSNAKAFYSIVLSALLREPSGSEYEFVKPGTVGVKCILPIERDGELPHGCGFIFVEGKMVMPTLQPRDQNNYSAITWKFWGDVLEEDGYLAAHDDWFAYQGGNLARGLNRKLPIYTEFMFFPSPDRLVPVDESEPAGALF